MKQSIAHISLVVRDYDEAIAFYCGKLKFDLIEDTYQPEQDKRWVVIAPPGWRENGGTTILLAKASSERQEKFVGNQAGGRVFLFLQTNNFRNSHPFRWLKGVAGDNRSNFNLIHYNRIHSY